MPWQESTPMSQRQAFIEAAVRPGSTISALCRQYGISRKTGYKWLQRARRAGSAGLREHSRRPHHSPRRTLPAVEEQVLNIRRTHPTWGGRKIRQILLNQGEREVPAISTITAILHRHQLIDPEQSQQRQRVQRFEREQPNQLWQMDFKGHFPLSAGGQCHP